jgi:hypothetical protein
MLWLEYVCHLVDSRCVWQHGQSPTAELDIEKDPVIPSSPRMKCLPRIKMPAEIISKLREMGDCQPLQTRPSIKSDFIF